MAHWMISDSVARDFLKRAYVAGNENFAELCDEIVEEMLKEMAGQSLPTSAITISASGSHPASSITITGSENHLSQHCSYFST